MTQRTRRPRVFVSTAFTDLQIESIILRKNAFPKLEKNGAHSQAGDVVMKMPYLTVRDADGVPIIPFFHRQFNEVLKERYGILEVEK
jgi:hypothetical protein